MDFEAIVHTYQEPLYWHLRRLVIDHEDARDLLQETFLQAYRNRWQLRREEAVRAWLYKIATHAAYRHLRRHREQPLSTEELSTLLLGRLEASAWVDYDDAAGVRFQEALLTLSEQQRVAFTLRYYDEMSYDEIAAITGSSAGSLRVSYHQAAQKISNYLKEHHIV